MASNHFGSVFRITTFGESHGKAVGVVIDGCPAGLDITEDEINEALTRRAPGQNPYTSPRQEKDEGHIVSGVFEGRTTGAPICILVWNQDADSSKYAPIKDLLRPGHANYTYLEKYGIFDYRGGGRSSARETIGRVAAGAVASKLLEKYQIKVTAYLQQVEEISTPSFDVDLSALHARTLASPIFCPDPTTEKQMCEAIAQARDAGDSVGGVVEFMATGLPSGLGEPIYQKLEAQLAQAMMSLPATKGIEIGDGFAASQMRGSAHNDLFYHQEGKVQTKTNHAGGTLGGMSNGMPLVGRVAFKPTSSIKLPMETVDLEGQTHTFHLPEGSRHDPCVTIRAVPIVSAMVSLVLADALLCDRLARA